MDEASKKTLLRTVPYGLYAATTLKEGGDHHVFILSWFTQTSFDPPLVACGVHKEGNAYQALHGEPGKPLTVNLLAEDQKDLAGEILKKPSFEADTVAGAPYEVGKNGCAALPETLGALELETVEEAGLDGDHAVFICRVTEARTFREGAPLTHANTGWHYGG
ncbi:MAG: flavin reductase family protein [Candidatus Thermoplasmatota archaeon]|nr:flavin reductase family protein [Candidatus Thermoplasmatota archaeon]